MVDAAVGLILAASPRKGGNSDDAAELVAQGAAELGVQSRVVHLRDFRFTPCTGCGVCDAPPEHRCRFAGGDDVEALFEAAHRAGFVCLVSPIYFYHVPAHFKALIDRSQSRYVRNLAHKPDLDHAAPCFSVLIGATRGKALFDGSKLTLRYFAQALSLSFPDPLCFRGFDGPGSLAADPQATALLRDLGRAAGRALLDRK